MKRAQKQKQKQKPEPPPATATQTFEHFSRPSPPARQAKRPRQVQIPEQPADLVAEYQSRQRFYSNSQFTYRIRHFAQRVPEVSKQLTRIRTKLRGTEMRDAQGEEQPSVQIQIDDFIRWIVQTLMLDEFEIAVWVRFIDRFSLTEGVYGIFEA